MSKKLKVMSILFFLVAAMTAPLLAQEAAAAERVVQPKSPPRYREAWWAELFWASRPNDRLCAASAKAVVRSVSACRDNATRCSGLAFPAMGRKIMATWICSGARKRLVLAW